MKDPAWLGPVGAPRAQRRRLRSGLGGERLGEKSPAAGAGLERGAGAAVKPPCRPENCWRAVARGETQMLEEGGERWRERFAEIRFLVPVCPRIPLCPPFP